MKLLSIAVPSYNSQDYLHRCLDTLIPGGDEVEIIVVDDGSADRTAAIARDYAERYPGIVRLEQKTNGGHGSAVNCGLAAATGKYFKVIDSDDWVNAQAYNKVLDCLRRQEAAGESLDILIVNYVYEYFYSGSHNSIQFSNAFPQEKLIGWEHLRKLRFDQLLGMHSLIHRTDLLRSCGLKLPEHTFYVDNIVAYQPLVLARKVMYLNADFYRYFIGRPDQSVNTLVLIRRIDQHIQVTRQILHTYHLEQDVADIRLRKYLYRFLSMLVSITIIHLMLSEDTANLRKIDLLWNEIREYDLTTYKIIRRNFINRAISIAGHGNPVLVRKGFGLVRRIFKFS